MHQTSLKIQYLLSMNRNAKQRIKIFFDASIIVASLIGAMALRLETFSFLELKQIYLIIAILVIPSILCFSLVGLYQSFFRYSSIEVVAQVSQGVFFSGILLITTKIIVLPTIPSTVPVIYALLLFLGISGVRFAFRCFFRHKNVLEKKYIAIYGAGAAGAQLIQSLKFNPKYIVRLVIDDAINLQGQRLLGHKVMSLPEASAKFDQCKITTVLLAMPNIGLNDRKKIVLRLTNFSVEVKTMPGISSLIDGSISINQFKDIEIESLLERETVKPDLSLLEKNITGKTVLVTGAGGSIGSELIRQIIVLKPDRLLLIDISEFAIYQIYNEVESSALNLGVELAPIVGSVYDRSFIASVFNKNKVDTIYHAAAYKHVPLMENNVAQAIKNNSLGTFVISEEAIRAKVSNFTLISSDKAVNPTNIMGASKRLAERVCQSFYSEQKVTKFTIVRFGNVLGSSGSVVPLFKKQIEAGGPITLTHIDVTRYFMTITEAVQLVLQASALSNGKDVLVLDMGKPVRILDVAIKMVHLSGLIPYVENKNTQNKGDIAIRVTGLRAGEKMFEELSYNDNLMNTSHPRIMAINEDTVARVQIKEIISALEESVLTNDVSSIKEILGKFANYVPK